jgi:hypothetical protein
MPKEEQEVIMKFDDLTTTVSPEIAAARGDIFESTEPVDPFSMTENLMNPDEDDGVLGVISGEKGGDKKAGEVETSGKGDENDDLELGDGKVENVPYPRFAKSIKKAKELTDEVATLRAELQRIKEGSSQVGDGGDGVAVGTGTEGADGVDDDASVAGKQKDAVQPAAATTTPSPSLAKQNEIKDKLAAMASEHSDAVIDGDHEKATSIMAEMMDLQSELTTERSMARISEQKQSEVARQTADDLFSRHSAFFAKQSHMNLFIEERNGFLAQGYGLKEALVAAEKELAPVLKVYGGKLDEGYDTDGNEVDDTLNPDGTLKAEVRNSIIKGKEKEAVARNVDTHKRQPPSTNAMGSGNRKDVFTPRNALTMTSAEMAALSKQEIAIARGDIVV